MELWGGLGVQRTADIWSCCSLANGIRKSGALFVFGETRLGLETGEPDIALMITLYAGN